MAQALTTDWVVSEDHRSEVMSKAEFSGITEKVLAVAVTSQNGRFLQPVKARAALTFNQASHCTCL